MCIYDYSWENIHRKPWVFLWKYCMGLSMNKNPSNQFYVEKKERIHGVLYRCHSLCISLNILVYLGKTSSYGQRSGEVTQPAADLETASQLVRGSTPYTHQMICESTTWISKIIQYIIYSVYGWF